MALPLLWAVQAKPVGQLLFKLGQLSAVSMLFMHRQRPASW